MSLTYCKADIGKKFVKVIPHSPIKNNHDYYYHRTSQTFPHER